MLVQSRQLAGASIISVHTSQVIGQLAGDIINPDKLEVVGYYCALPSAKKNRPVLLTQSVRQAAGRKIFIDSADELTEPDELIRHQAMIKLGYVVVGKTVRTAGGKRLGKVDEYVVNTDSWQIQKIYVKQSIFKNLTAHNLIIDRSQVVEVNDKELIVDDGLAGKPAIVTPPAAT